MDKLQKILREYLNKGSERIDVTMVLALIDQCRKDTKEQLLLHNVSVSFLYDFVNEFTDTEIPKEAIKETLDKLNEPKTMSKIVVLKTEGKGKNIPHSVTVMLFDKTEDADNYCKEHTEEGKYWSFAEIISVGDKLAPWYMSNN